MLVSDLEGVLNLGFLEDSWESMKVLEARVSVGPYQELYASTAFSSSYSSISEQ